MTEQSDVYMDEKQEPTQEDIRLFHAIAQGIRGNPNDYREAGKWLDDYCSDDAYWQRLEKKVEELKTKAVVHGYTTSADVGDLEQELAEKKPPCLHKLIAEAYHFLTDICKGQASISEADARRILLITWLLADDETESPEVCITRVQTRARESAGDLGGNRLNSAKSWMGSSYGYWMRLVRAAWERVGDLSATRVDGESKPIWGERLVCTASPSTCRTFGLGSANSKGGRSQSSSAFFAYFL